MTEQEGNVNALAEDLARIDHAQAGHPETFDICREARCSSVRRVTRRGGSYAGPTAADLEAMGELRRREA